MTAVAEKIKKLLALATSANENEAKLASQKALEDGLRHGGGQRGFGRHSQDGEQKNENR